MPSYHHYISFDVDKHTKRTIISVLGRVFKQKNNRTKDLTTT